MLVNYFECNFFELPVQGIHGMCNLLAKYLLKLFLKLGIGVDLDVVDVHELEVDECVLLFL